MTEATMISQPTHLLFPNLPPELRQEIYTHLSNDPSTPACTTSIPLALKTFHCKHTTLQLLPIHHGSAGLLSLPPNIFPEAAEYHHWLLSNAVSLRIGVHFRGRVNTFVQADWDKKVAAHINKLAKRHPWLRKVSNYDIKILWSAEDTALKSKNGKRVAGSIPSAMADSLTCITDERVKQRKGEVKISLILSPWFAMVNSFQGERFGLDVFLHEHQEGSSSSRATTAGFKTLVKEVWIASAMDYRSDLIDMMGSSATMEDFSSFLPREKERVVGWLEETIGQLVMRKTVVAEEASGSETTPVITVGIDKDDQLLFGLYLRECWAWN
ncbi:hypothetical protein GMOD_00006163 [Pyrenophora seminiperda CCB06]|uniref:Uncharacterized protein n=1 Tax=Pyrenophora seminiperda CCB06 TaxID=1302712 RepID=A0A3M7M4P4_9PLEO|nr:hypothetical protein GMOD_00006163 [Pyrenophora seminiperda CCB06]